MRRHLGSFLPALVLIAVPVTVLAGCNDDDSGAVAKDPASADSTVSPPVDSPSAEPFGYQVVDTITVTGAGGTVSEAAVPLTDDTAVQGFLAQFTAGDLPQQVKDTVAGTEAPEGWVLYGAVVAIGCDSPDQVEVDESDGGVTITAVAVPSPRPECLAAMTTVALVLVDK